MNIAELINECGVDDARVQFLDQCADSLDYNIKRGTRITFGTEEPITPNGTVKLGIVVWLPRDAVKAALAKAKGDEYMRRQEADHDLLRMRTGTSATTRFSAETPNTGGSHG